MKKVLILNGSHSEISLIEAAHKIGFYVITTGNDPRLLGHKYSDKYICEDYSDYEKVTEIAKRENIDNVVSCANDFGIITASYISEELGIKGHDSFLTTCLLHQKDKFKEFAIENNLLVPSSVSYQNEDEALNNSGSICYPVIVKPTDMTGGKGVSVAADEHEYYMAVKKAFYKSRVKKIVVEQYIKGSYHSFSTFVVEKKVIAYFSDNEYSFLNPFFVATSAGPADRIGEIKNLLIGQVEKIADLLNLVDGLFHIQYVMDSQGIPYIIDITRRCSGDLYPEPVEHSTGIPWSKWIVMSEMGFPSDAFREKGVQSKYCGRHCIMSSKNGIVKGIDFSKEISNNIYKKIELGGVGTMINDYLHEKLGVVFYEFSSRDEMIDKVGRINELIKVIVK